MDTLRIIINVVVMLVLIGLLVWMQKKHVSFTKRVFTGLGLGLVFGVILQWAYGAGSDVFPGPATGLTWWAAVMSGCCKWWSSR